MAYEFNGYGNVKVAWQQCKGTGAGPPNTVCHTTLVDRLASRMGCRLPQAVKIRIIFRFAVLYGTREVRQGIAIKKQLSNIRKCYRFTWFLLDPIGADPNCRLLII